IGPNNSCICKVIDCKHVYEYPFDENVLKNHYMKKYLKIWESIKESKRG
ncbi:2112_t:CDS:1, partial [Scutellospora calospora]